MTVGIGTRETVLTLEDIGRPGEPGFGQQRRMHALARSMRGMNAFDGGARVIKLRQPAAE